MTGIEEKRDRLGVGPGNPTTLASGKFGSGTVTVAFGRNANEVVSPAKEESAARGTL